MPRRLKGYLCWYCKKKHYLKVHYLRHRPKLCFISFKSDTLFLKYLISTISNYPMILTTPNLQRHDEYSHMRAGVFLRVSIHQQLTGA